MRGFLVVTRAATVGALVLSFVGFAQAQNATIPAIGVENEYADVIAQIGGQYVNASAIEIDPNTDPHTFEASPRIAAQIAGAKLIVENGLGYDDWADKMAAAAPDATRRVINVQRLRGLTDSTPNPHLWYDPATMPAVAHAVAGDLTSLQPAHAAYFAANAQRFIASLAPWHAAMDAFRKTYLGTPMAISEPVPDDMLQTMGVTMATPFTLQAAIMNGTDPSPQDVAIQNALFNDHKVKVFVYNQQVTDPLTQSFVSLARRNGIPIVGVYETMPAPGYSYQSWMLAEVAALRKAVVQGTSTESLLKDTR